MTAVKAMMIFMSAVILTILPLFVFAGEPIGVQEDCVDGICFMCGGVGIDSRTYMQENAAKYNLKLEVAAKSGAYLADANVVIFSASGKKVLETVMSGPWMLVKLPKGNYRIVATLMDRQQGMDVSVAAKLKRVILSWNI